MTIDWTTPLAAIASDNSAIAAAIRTKVTVAGQLYDRAGHPDVRTEPADHIAFRADYASQLGTRDRAAASVDGKPLTTIDPTNLAVSRRQVAERLQAASLAVDRASPVGKLLIDMLAAKLPTEPRPWIEAYYAPYNGIRPAPRMGDIQSALIDALAELSAYVSFA